MLRPGKGQGLAAQLKRCLVRYPQVLAVYVYGSVAHRRDRRSGEMDLSSDLDVGILLDSSVSIAKRWQWWQRLYRVLTPLVRQDLDLVIMNGAPLGLVHQILKTGQRIYECPGRRYRREEACLLIDALDFLPTQELIEEKAIRRIKTNHG